MSNDTFDAFDFDDFDPDRPGNSGGGRLPAGGYCFLITEVVAKNDKGSTQIECEVVDAKDKDLIGRKHIEYLPHPDKEHSAKYNEIKLENIVAWCYAAKTTSSTEIRERQKVGLKFHKGWLEAMVSRRVLGIIKEDSYTNDAGTEKTSSKCEGRVWAIDNPKAKAIPGWVDVTKAAPSGDGSNEFDGLV